MENLGVRLKRLRSNRGYSVSLVARKVGVSDSTYREWEAGREIRGEPYLMIAQVLEVSLSYLLLGEEGSHGYLLAQLQELQNLVSAIRTRL